MRRFKAAICSGVVPQQPPSNCTPAAAKRAVFSAKGSGAKRKTVSPLTSSGKPALGSTSTGTLENDNISSITGTICSGPALQLVPNATTPRFCMVSTKISGVDPVKLTPSSKVMDTIIGKLHCWRMATTAALASARSNCVSMKNKSTPPCKSPRTCSL